MAQSLSLLLSPRCHHPPKLLGGTRPLFLQHNAQQHPELVPWMSTDSRPLPAGTHPQGAAKR